MISNILLTCIICLAALGCAGVVTVGYPRVQSVLIGMVTVDLAVLFGTLLVKVWT